MPQVSEKHMLVKYHSKQSEKAKYLGPSYKGYLEVWRH